MQTNLMQNPSYISPAIPFARAQGQRARVGAVLRGWGKSALRHWQNRKMIAELEALDDHLLADIGIPREAIRKHLAKAGAGTRAA